MALSRITITPGMDENTMIYVINTNLQQVEAENRNKVIRDEQDDDRIIIGRIHDGTYGIVISNKGVNVYDIFPKGV